MFFNIDSFTFISEKQGKSRCRRQKKDSKRKRARTACNIEGCRGKVVNLKRHYEDCHPDEHFNTLSHKKPKYNRTLRSWKCREHGCCWEGDRLDKHLLNCYKMGKNKVANNIETLLEEQFGKGSFHLSSLSDWSQIGDPRPDQASVIEALKKTEHGQL